MYAFRIKVLGGLNLYNNEFGVQAPGSKTSKFKFECKPNPYVEIKVEDQTRATRIIRWEVNPVFNEEFIFTCNSRKPILKLRVYDQLVASEVGKLVSGNDAIIGEADVNLHGLLSKSEREMWVQLKGTRGKGELGVVVQECYRTSVAVVAGHDLKASDAFTKTSDVYLTLQVGQQEKQQTSVKGWTINPRWEGESFNFYVPYSPIDCYLQIKVWDKDIIKADEPMGWVNYNLNNKTALRDPATGQIKSATVRIKVKNDDAKKASAGELELTIGCNDMYVPDCPDAGAVTAEAKALWPPCAPQTCTFEVKAIGAFNLAAGDPLFVQGALDDIAKELVFQKFKPQTGSSDPFLRVECEGTTYDSSKIANTLHPVWNETLHFVCRNKAEAIIKLSVFDHDILTENDCLGQTTLPAAMLRSGEQVQVWGQLDRGARGEVGILLTQAYQIKVRVCDCFDFPAMDLNGMSDPFLKVSIEGKTYQTRIVGNDRNPIFDEDFRWAVTRLGPDVFLKIEAFDSDFQLFTKQILPDVIGTGEVCLGALKRGVANNFTVALTKGGKPAGRVNVIVTDEMPLPPSVLAQLGDLGATALNAAAEKLAAEQKAFFKIITPGDDKTEEVAEPQDPKTAQRPRYSRFKVTVLAARGLKKQHLAPSCYVAVLVPSQGAVHKTKTSTELKNPDFGEEFDIDVATRTSGGLTFLIFDSSIVPQNETWHDAAQGKASYTINVPFRTLNKGTGPIRGSPGDDLWLTLDDGATLVVRIEEDYRWEVTMKSIRTPKAISDTADTDITATLSIGTSKMPCHAAVVQKKEFLAATDERFTVFTRTKNNLKLEVDAGTFGKGEVTLADLKRGIAKDLEIQLSGPQGAIVTVTVKEEEKMGLLDQLVDIAGNAAKLLGKALGDAKDYVASGAAAADAQKAATDGLNAIGGAIGGLFGGK